MKGKGMEELGFTHKNDSRLTDTQIKQLLKPIHPSRIVQAQGHSHVSQQDVVAHLIRVFGFGNFDIQVLNTELVFEEPSTDKDGQIRVGRWDVCYKALVRLTIKAPDGTILAHYENGSTGVAQNQSRGDGHDLAYKSAISLSVKRSAINLGDQFGLSLYNKGQREALVMASLAYVEKEDVQENITQQVSLGNDETEKEPESETDKPADKVNPPEIAASKPKVVVPIEEASKILTALVPKILAEESEERLRDYWHNAKELGLLDSEIKVGANTFLLRDVIINRQKEVKELGSGK